MLVQYWLNPGMQFFEQNLKCGSWSNIGLNTESEIKLIFQSVKFF